MTGNGSHAPGGAGPGYITRWRPSSVSPPAAAFARDVVTQVAPQGRERAKNLLWAAGKLADYGLGLGLEPVPGVLLHPSTAERFTRCAPGLSGAARRTLRTNLRFIGRRVVPQLYPADLPLPRGRSKQPYIYDASSSGQEHATTIDALLSVEGIADVVIASRPSQLPPPGH